MKAIRIHQHGDSNTLQLESLPKPEIQSDQVLVRIKAVALNHLDIWVRKGIPGIKLPMILGSDGSGILEEIGEDISTIKCGDEVMIQPLLYCGECSYCQRNQENLCTSFGLLGETCDGTNAQYIAVNEQNIIPKPGHLSFEEASAFSLVGQTAYEMLVQKAQIQKGETVMIWGASSGVGSMAVQIAKALDCHVIAISGSEEKLLKIKKLGADETIHYQNESVYEKVMDLTDGFGVDLVFEHVGQATWETSMKVLRKGGRVVTCGATTGPKAQIDLTHIFYKQLSILGSTMGSVNAMKEVTKLLKQKKIKPVIDRVFPLENIQEAHEYLEAGKQFGKVVLSVSHD
ncbi:MAG: zinc-binding dehydrogenase [Candidatus Marinimicrobia bacterium]|jgi:NADPH:quinone reductase-like Zn-dependent oxidoreductase|nr:zinc-binding dehydrogenase [Candidatus Neomarinimicrobiota bacterium]MBT4990659.1 zinc-binding dehydrogenase [Candidatus Neomarinimicrobiota bacterium]